MPVKSNPGLVRTCATVASVLINAFGAECGRDDVVTKSPDGERLEVDVHPDGSAGTMTLSRFSTTGNC
jgi:hypothetical protein